MKNRFEIILKKIKKFVDENNAVLVIFSDHGEEWDESSEGHHNSVSDNVLRVPLMFYGKNIKSSINNRLIRTIDFAPTIVDLLSGSKTTVDMDGKKLNLYINDEIVKKTYAISKV